MNGRGLSSLDRLLTLEAFETEGDGGGGTGGAWRVLGRRWARVEPISAASLRIGDVMRPELTHRITLRWSAPDAPSRPKPGQRFREGARVFAVEGVAEIDAVRRWLLCWAREGVRG